MIQVVGQCQASQLLEPRKWPNYLVDHDIILVYLGVNLFETCEIVCMSTRYILGCCILHLQWSYTRVIISIFVKSCDLKTVISCHVRRCEFRSGSCRAMLGWALTLPCTNVGLKQEVYEIRSGDHPRSHVLVCVHVFVVWVACALDLEVQFVFAGVFWDGETCCFGHVCELVRRL